MGEPKSEVNQELESTDSTKFMKLRKRFYQTSYGAHYTDLMLEDIGKMQIHKATLEMINGIIQFI